jgi:hypothetical protein
MKYGINTRKLIDALNSIGIGVQELETRESVDELSAVRIVGTISRGEYTEDGKGTPINDIQVLDEGATDRGES